MPRKGMRNIFFSSHRTPSSSVSSPLRPPPTPLYSYSNSMLNETMRNAEEIINRWNPDTSSFAKVTSLFYESKTEAREFVKCVRDLQRAMHFLISQDSSSETLIRAHSLMQIAMKRLEKEFYQILSINREHLNPESIAGRSSITSRSSVSSDYEGSVGSVNEIQIAGNSIIEVENEAAVAMSDLRLIADCMISCGYGKECVKIYKTVRKSIVDEGLYRLGIEPISSKRIQKMDWEVVELKIKNWVNAVKIAVTALFYGERILCDNVFSSSNVIKQSCFCEISRQGATILFRFPEQVVKSKKSPEKIFRVLDLYSAIYNLSPEIESIFSFESTSDIRSQVMSSLIKLGEAVCALLTEFESTIQKDSSRSPVQDGGVHRLTRYAMTCVSLLADYSEVLPDIVNDWPLPIRTPLPEFYFDPKDSESAISHLFAWLILILLCKLDLKAELYKDIALSYLFLANNLQFVVSKVRSTSNIQFILGKDWISKHEMKIKQYAANYERVGWQKVVSALPENHAEGEISLEEAKTSFNRFNSAFETVYRTQSSWIVPDNTLRSQIKVSLYNKLLAAYRLFYDTYRVPLKEEKNLRNIVKFVPDDLGKCLSELFYGEVTLSSSSSSVSSKYSSSH